MKKGNYIVLLRAVCKNLIFKKYGWMDSSRVIFDYDKFALDGLQSGEMTGNMHV